MSYLAPSEFVTKMVDAGESKVFMSTRDTLIRAFMAGAILALAAVFAVMVTQQTGYPIIGAVLATQAPAGTPSRFVDPSRAHGLWLEFRPVPQPP